MFEAFLFAGIALLVPGSILAGVSSRLNGETFKRESMLMPVFFAVLVLLFALTATLSFMAFIVLAAVVFIAGLAFAIRVSLSKEHKNKWIFPLAIALQIGGGIALVLAVSTVQI